MHSDFDIEALRHKMPIQTGAAAETIAGVCRQLLYGVEYAADAQRATDRREDLARELSSHNAQELVR